ncbi:glycosyltransferase family protein [Ferruginibacter albus]|uniref:glycosyltransferase family 2 protein n=1 Tax=Ferruginibacter albus TaxID=2875540 RepID=UPI001CC77AAE|nr:glycosyltransferase family 2 protein [Ferruginibacter albus]UAY53493.1 glycosyltransferase family 2 protein [Ferruginibacter albus]
MKVSGFSFVKNAVKYSYPVVESIQSILPLVDEFVICLGNSDDNTNELIASIHSDKIKIIHSVWDDSLREGGKVLAVETNKALDATAADSDWLFYIQADEVVHEKYHPVILEAMKKYKDDKRIEGLLFHYTHFFGSYRYIGDGRKWYTKEIRVIRNDKHIRSYKDAQGFRFNDDRKLNVKLINAYIYHYGWVKDPATMMKKVINSGNLYHSEEFQEKWQKEIATPDNKFDYSKVDSVMEFTETHPAVMQKRVSAENWDFVTDSKKKNFKSLKHKVLYFLWQTFGWRPFEYRNYKKI